MALLLRAFVRLARYNRWMNERLHEKAACLSDAERRLDRGAFFKSIHGTCNHLILGDRLWITHWAAQSLLPAVPAVLRLDDIEGLDAELYADFGAMRAARRDLDDWLVAALDSADGSLLERESVERWPDGRVIRRPCWIELQHLFNHQTHHRGQLTALLMQAGIDPGVTDIVALPDDA